MSSKEAGNTNLKVFWHMNRQGNRTQQIFRLRNEPLNIKLLQLGYLRNKIYH